MPRFQFAIVKLSAPTALALALVMGPSWGVLATPGQIHLIKDDSAGLRAEPDKSSKIIDRLVRGDRVMEFERRGRWLKVQQMGTVAPEGWVNETLLAPEPRPRPPVPVEPQSSDEDQALQYTSPDRVTYIVGHGFHRRFLRRHKKFRRDKKFRRAFRHRRLHNRKFSHRGRKFRHDNQDGRFRRHRHDGKPHGAARGERRISGPHLRSQPEGG